jgi:hypothetical protein
MPRSISRLTGGRERRVLWTALIANAALLVIEAALQPTLHTPSHLRM